MRTYTNEIAHKSNDVGGPIPVPHMAICYKMFPGSRGCNSGKETTSLIPGNLRMISQVPPRCRESLGNLNPAVYLGVIVPQALEADLQIPPSVVSPVILTETKSGRCS